LASAKLALMLPYLSLTYLSLTYLSLPYLSRSDALDSVAQAMVAFLLSQSNILVFKHISILHIIGWSRTDYITFLVTKFLTIHRCFNESLGFANISEKQSVHVTSSAQMVLL
jgi:hypothetical protein